MRYTVELPSGKYCLERGKDGHATSEGCPLLIKPKHSDYFICPFAEDESDVLDVDDHGILKSERYCPAHGY